MHFYMVKASPLLQSASKPGNTCKKIVVDSGLNLTLIFINMKHFSTIIKGIALVMLLLGVSEISAQNSDLKIYNGTDCYFELVIYAYDCAPDDCTLGPVCIGPGLNLVHPCGGANLEWMSADIVPTDADCNYCGVYGSTVERVTSCGAGNTMSPFIGTCGECGEVQVQFIGPDEILIQ